MLVAAELLPAIEVALAAAVVVARVVVAGPPVVVAMVVAVAVVARTRRVAAVPMVAVAVAMAPVAGAAVVGSRVGFHQRLAVDRPRPAAAVVDPMVAVEGRRTDSTGHFLVVHSPLQLLGKFDLQFCLE